MSYKEYDPDELKQLQQAELGILLEVDKLCTENQIPYFLDSGAALGAVRHNGFIPWDDDIDIGMLRPDYERFVELAKDKLGVEYIVSNAEINSTHAACFTKIWLKNTIFETAESRDAGLNQGIFIDIIPYDLLAEDADVAQKQSRRGRFWQKVSYLYHSKRITLPHGGLLGGLEKIACCIAHYACRLLFTHESIVRQFKKAIDAGQNSGSQQYAILSWYTKQPFAIEDLFPVQYADFEGHKLPIPGNVNKYLANLYGASWSDLPPEGKRRNHAPEKLEF